MEQLYPFIYIRLHISSETAFFSNNKEYTELKELENFQMSENKSFISLIILYTFSCYPQSIL